ncbi:hypothetical protein G6F53_013920 [Rhizopus delemar]|nr:hypothetical protein G6F53_013920 [Rhizopus delemar]
MMGWLGTALARAGYLVIAVDHPGNNGADPMTLPGSVLSWLRADDLRAALAASIGGGRVLGRWLHRAAGRRCTARPATAAGVLPCTSG